MMQKFISKQKLAYGALAIIGLFIFGNYVAPVFASALYQQGETLDPNCLPTDPNCTVALIMGEASTTAYVRSSYSARFGTAVNVSTVEQALDQIYNFTYTAPAITLVSSPGGQVLEAGSSIASVGLTAVTTKTSNPITAVSFLRNASTINSVGSPHATGGSEVYTDSTPVTSNVTYTAKVSDGTATTTSNGIGFTFVYPYYYGVGAPGLSPTQIQALTKSVTTKTNKTVTTSPSAQVYYFAYPQSYGALTSILDPNNFETINDYTRTVQSFTMLDSSVQNYYVYQFNNLTSQTNFTNTYKY